MQSQTNLGSYVQDVPVYDRHRVISAIQKYRDQLNHDYLNTTPWYKAWPHRVILRKLKYLLVPAIVSAAYLLFNLQNELTWLNAVPFIAAGACFFWFAIELVRLSNAMSERWGPFAVKRTLVEPETVDLIEQYAGKIPQDALSVVKTFLAEEPGGKVFVGEAVKFNELVQPTSLRLRLGNQTATLWVADQVREVMTAE